MPWFWFFLGLLIAPVGLAAPQTLKTALFDSSSPRFAGDVMRCARAIEQQNEEIVFSGWQQRVTPARAERLLDDGKLDVLFVFLRSPDRERRFQFVEPALFEFRTVVAVRRHDLVQISSLSDIEHLEHDNIVITVKDSVYADALKSFRFHTDSSAMDFSTALRRLLKFKGRFVYGPEYSLLDARQTLKAENAITVLPHTLQRYPGYIMVRKFLSSVAIERLSEAVRKVKENTDACTF